jgi:hypothetical protein
LDHKVNEKGGKMKPILALSIILLSACDQQLSASADVVDTKDGRRESAAVRQVITCHELSNGRPSPDPKTYELLGKGFYSTGPDGERQLISSEGKLVLLSQVTDEDGSMDTLAMHTVQGGILTRTVLWQRAGKSPETAFVERFNFIKQTVIDTETGEDSCNHDSFRSGLKES